MDRRLILQLIVVTLAAVMQSVTWLSLGGVKINIVLITMLALAFLIKDWRWYFFLTIWSALILRVGDGWSVVVFGLVAIPLTVYLIKRFLPWQSLISYLIFVIVATTGFYGLIDWRFLVDHSFIFLHEMAYNLLFGGLIYLIAAKLFN